MKRIFTTLLISVLALNGCGTVNSDKIPYTSAFEKENVIRISDEKTEFNGEIVGESGDVFVSRDIIYYQEKQNYESGNPYGEGDANDMHTEEEANTHQVINITKSGAYRISGTLSAGQIRVDLGEDAKKNPDAVVELILDDAHITCTVAPAILFMNVYECDGTRTAENATSKVDTSEAGAVLVLADGSENTVNGAYVAKIYKDGEGDKKLCKQDGAIYSYMSMNVYGGGTLNLFAENEGLDTERHLTINGGNINIYSDNDGINTNEDGVSVTTINGGNIYITAGLGEEGDGIDSNGWLVINGGNVVSGANPKADAGLDSDLGSYINGGTVVALGSTMDWPESDSDQVTINLQFSRAQKAGSEIVVKDSSGKTVFSYKPDANDLTDGKIRDFRGAVISSSSFELEKEYTIYVDGVQQSYTGTDFGGGPGGFRGNRSRMDDGKRPEMPEGERPDFRKGERPEIPEGERPDFRKGERPEMPEGERPEMPDGERPDFERGKSTTEPQTKFLMKDKVNRFSGVSEIK